MHRWPLAKSRKQALLANMPERLIVTDGKQPAERSQDYKHQPFL
jgi:hypothetical protein